MIIVTNKMRFIYREMMPETRKNKVFNPIFVTGMESTMIIMSDKMPKDEDEKKVIDSH